jgi:putative DNA primase/helicase
VIVERLLAISGEDPMTVARKFKGEWNGRLPSRFEIFTNELPAFSDESTALAGRFLVALFPNSFYGREDVGLLSRLLIELPGILNWAIEGHRRLRERGHFVQPARLAEAIETIEMLGAPVRAFVRDCCDVGPEKEDEVDELHRAWRGWCEEEGRHNPGTKEWFGRNLRTAVPGLTVNRKRVEGQRRTFYQGICRLDGF